MMTLVICVMLAGLLPQQTIQLTLSVCASELLLGVVLAFGFHTAFASLDLVGKLLDLQIGINAAGVFDPSASHLTGVISELLMAIAIILFFVLNIHHTLLKGLFALYSVVPVGTFKFDHLNVKALLVTLGHQFIFAFVILLPVILAVWLVDIAFAVMSRSMPQANIYFLALPVKFAVGLALLFFSLPLIVQNIPRLFDQPLKLVVF